MKKTLLFSLVIGMLVRACSGTSQGGRFPMGNGNSYSTTGQYASNGEQIYFTATDQNGNLIHYSGGPAFGGMMMSQYQTCAACHGANGQGGKHIMHMDVMDSSAISYTALNEMEAKEAGTAVQPDGYTLADFRDAVINGKHPDGDKLKTEMPRWQMSDQDLQDLFAYLKTLP
jgi:cytochrome c oxidase subunit 2